MFKGWHFKVHLKGLKGVFFSLFWGGFGVACVVSVCCLLLGLIVLTSFRFLKVLCCPG